MTLNVNLLLCRQSYACCDQTAESRGFRYKVALYLSCPHIKFDYEIKGNYPQDTYIIFCYFTTRSAASEMRLVQRFSKTRIPLWKNC